MPGSPNRLLPPAAVLLALVLLHGAALAQERIVVTEFANDEGARFEDLIIDELLFRGDYEIISYETFIDEVDTYGATLDEFLDDPGLIVALSESLGYSAIVDGQLDRDRRPRELTLTVYDASTGLSTGRVVIGVRSGQLDDPRVDDRLADLEDLIDRAAPARQPEPEPEPVARRPRRETATPPAPTPTLVQTRERPTRAGWLHIEAGLDLVQRGFTLASSEAGIQYDSGFYPGLEGTIEIYPVKLASPGTLDGLGIQFRLARYFVDTVLVLEDLGQDLDIPTRHKEFGISLLYRHAFGAFELLGRLGYESLAFTLGDNSVYQSSEYRGVAIAVGGRYQIVRDLLLLGATVEIRPAPKLGDDEVEAFGQGDAFGFGFGAAVTVTPIDRLAITGAYRFLRYGNTFDGTGTSELTGTLDATDTYNQLGLRVSYAF